MRYKTDLVIPSLPCRVAGAICCHICSSSRCLGTGLGLSQSNKTFENKQKPKQTVFVILSASVCVCVCVCVCACLFLDGVIKIQKWMVGGSRFLQPFTLPALGDVCVGQQGLRLLPWRNRFLPMAVSLDGSSLGIQTGSPCSSHYTCAILPCVRSLRLD